MKSVQSKDEFSVQLDIDELNKILIKEFKLESNFFIASSNLPKDIEILFRIPISISK